MGRVPGRRARSWGFWSELKLGILRDYLDAFTTASNRSPERVYLDAFAGEGLGISRTSGHAFEGSATIALNIDDPPFTVFRYFELHNAERLERRLRSAYPGRDIRVYGGDCNEMIPRALSLSAHSPSAMLRFAWRTSTARRVYSGRRAGE